MLRFLKRKSKFKTLFFAVTIYIKSNNNNFLLTLKYLPFILLVVISLLCMKLKISIISELIEFFLNREALYMSHNGLTVFYSKM